MNKPLAEPKMLASTILVLLLTAAALIPARALAAPPEGGEGSGTPLIITPEAVSFPKTTVGYQAPTQEVQILNKGEGVSIGKIAIEGGEGSFSLQGSTCGYLGEGEWCTVWIGFSPGSEGEQSATAEVLFSGERPNQAFTVNGTAVPPKLSFAPESYDFGLQPANYESVSTAIKIVNDGEGAVKLGDFEIGGPDSYVFWMGDSDCWGSSLEPGEACTMEVSFGPRDRTSYDAELRARVGPWTFSAPLSGEGGAAVIEAPENPVAFAPVTVGAKGPVRTITLTNSGNVPASFFISIIAGGDAGSFKLLDEDCSAAPLEPAGTCSAHVQFAPESVGPKTARLAFFGDGSDGMMVFLQGEGQAAAATLLPGSHDFGTQVAGGKSAAQAFAVHNDGSGALALDRVEIVGADPDQFAIAGEECSDTVLGPGEECQVRVRFAPGSAGAKAAKLRVRGAAGSLSSALSGLGGQPAAAAAEGIALAAAVPAAAPAAGNNAVTTETRWLRPRHKRRIIRGQGIKYVDTQPLRRTELRSGAARHRSHR